jgi:phage shock protein C
MSTLARPVQGRVVAGVCAGIAQRFGLGVTLVRVLTAASVVFFGLSLWIYILLWIVMPSELS